MPFGLPGPATLESVIGCASACICLLSLLGTPRSLLLQRRRGGSLRPIWALILRHSLRDLPLVGTRGGNGSGSYCRGGRVCPCKQLTHSHQVVVVGNDDWGGVGAGVPVAHRRSKSI